MTFLLASITPVIIFLYIIYLRDTIKEPILLLARCFVGGFGAYIIAYILETIVGIWSNKISNPFIHAFYKAVINAALPEEAAKFYMLYKIIWKKGTQHFDQHYDGIIYAVFVSLGLAMLENITYVFHGGLGVALVRAVLSVPAHGLFAVQMGYFLSKARFGNIRVQNINLTKSLFVPVLFHGAFDFVLMYAEQQRQSTGLVILLAILFCVIVIMLWRLGLREIRIMRQKDKAQLI